MTPTAAKPKAKITLADLSDEDQRALMLEAREASKRNPVDVKGFDALTDHEKAVRGLMDARDHQRGCPVQEGAELGRVEGYDARRPADPVSGAPAKDVGVVRCVNCGGATVLDTRLEVALEAATVADPGDEGDATLT